jgi:hypothetical protein
MNRALWIVLVIAWWGAWQPCGAAQTLVDTDFAEADRPAAVYAEPPADPPVTGLLPDGWADNSRWAQLRVDYGKFEQNGRQFLRMDLIDRTTGQAQMVHPLGAVDQAGLYRLTVKLRRPGPSDRPFPADLRLGVRQIDPPYRWLWTIRPALGHDWSTQVFYGRVEASDQPVGLFVVLGEVAAVDFASVKLDRLSEQQVIEALKKAYPEGGPANLLRHSRLPLGLPAGWFIDRDYSDGDQVIVHSDDQQPGPTGCSALRVEGMAGFRIHGEPFAVPLAFKAHTASVFVRGTGQAQLSVMVDGQQVGAATRELTEKAGWVRLTASFEPKLMARASHLVIAGRGRLWFDGFMVNEGGQAEPYQPQMPIEVALAVGRSDARAARVQFDDEPARLRWSVTGQAEGCMLKARVTNVYGESVDLPDIRLRTRSGIIRFGLLDYDRFEGRSRGSFRVEAWVERDGNRVSPHGELVVHRVRRPRFWATDAPQSRFGVHTNSTTRHNTMAKAIGINWVRLHDAGTQYIGWAHLEPEPGQWRFFDEPIRRYRQHHLKILGGLQTAPTWASYRAEQPDAPQHAYFDQWWVPRDLEAWADYCQTVISRYQDEIDIWDIWNEPYWPSFFHVRYDPDAQGARDGYVHPVEPTRDFVRLARKAYWAAEQVDPNIRVTGICTRQAADSPLGTEWTENMVLRNGLDFCHVMVYHHYQDGQFAYPGDVLQRGLERAFEPVLERTGRFHKPIWMTEGSGTRQLIGDGLYNHVVPYPVTENVLGTADRHCRYVIGLLVAGAEKVFLYSMHGHSGFGSPGAWKTLVTDDGYLHPAAAAHAELAHQLDTAEYKKTITPADRINVFIFSHSPTHQVAVIVPRPGAEPYQLPTNDWGGHPPVDLFGNALPPGVALRGSVVYLPFAGSIEELVDLFGG